MTHINQRNKVILATLNKGKLKEFQSMLEPLGISVYNSSSFPEIEAPQVIEDGETFEANALLKAQAFYKTYGIPALADDSGLTIKELGGAPGVYSARFAGDNATDQENIYMVLEKLHDVPDGQREAAFICVLAYVDDTAEPLVAEGRCEGNIIRNQEGEHGFGYDPIFYLPLYGKTMAQLPAEEKNKISHRSKALNQLIPQLKARLSSTNLD